jgi:hypothetical protein
MLLNCIILSKECIVLVFKRGCVGGLVHGIRCVVSTGRKARLAMYERCEHSTRSLPYCWVDNMVSSNEMEP